MSRFAHQFRAWLARPKALVLGPAGVHAGGADIAFADWCAANAGAACTLVVGARLLNDFVFEPGLPLPDAAAREAYARQQFAHYFGSAAQRWPLATWRAAGSGGASALHGVDLAALLAAARRGGVSLRRVEPFWAPLLRHLRRNDTGWPAAEPAALAWVEGALLSWMTLEAGRITGLRALRLAEPTQAALEALLSELRAGTPARRIVLGGFGLDERPTPAWPGVQLLGRLDGVAADPAIFDTPPDLAGVLPAPDFLGARAPRSALAWPLAATGALVLATAAWSLAASHGALVESQEKVGRLERIAAQQQLSHPAAGDVTAARPASAIKDAEVRDLRSVQASLDAPWGPLLGAVERAGLGADDKSGARVDWLDLEYSAARASLHLTGLAADKADALQVVDRLGATPGLSAVLLNRLEAGGTGLAGQRFEIGAHVDALALAQLPAPRQEARR
jgi:hypothetical protein